MKKKIVSKSSKVNMAVLGAGLAGLAAGAYFFYGPKGKKHQKAAKAWSIKMKGDIVEKLEKARDISEPIYNEIVDKVAAKYEKGAKAGRNEIESLAKDLKKHWKTISAGAKAGKRDVVKNAKKKYK